MKSIITGLFLSATLSAAAQDFPAKHYPQHYFRNPLDIPILLAGNFGELRPNHFHSGMDIKTEGRIGLPVYAAADGYISRAGVSNTGFGNVIYITHPNGYTTLYGHLHRFNPELEKYVKNKEYEQESWKIDLDLPAGLFPVKKGQFIAWSGSTGAAAGPHVHFEIRNSSTQKPLNPLLFGFAVKDDIPPSVFRVAVYDRNKSIYEQTPLTFAVRKEGTGYVPAVPEITVKTDKVGFGVDAIDRQNGTSNNYGVYEELMFDDNRLQTGFQLDDIGYEETRYVNAHVDYKTRKLGGPFYQLLFSLPGNKLEIYRDFDGNGTIDLSDGRVHAIRILVKDAYDNTSTVKFNIREAPGTPAASGPADCPNRMYPDSKDIFENTRVQFYLEEGSLYDAICFQYQEIPDNHPNTFSPVYRLHTPAVPLQYPFVLRLKTTRPVPENLRNKLVIVRSDPRSGRKDPVYATWDGDWLSGVFRDFGDFTIQADNTPPVIIPVHGLHNGINLAHSSEIAFRIGDDLSGVKEYRAELDGKWLMFAQKGNLIYYTFDEHCERGEHRLKLTVTDEANNQSDYILNFKR